MGGTSVALFLTRASIDYWRTKKLLLFYSFFWFQGQEDSILYFLLSLTDLFQCRL